MRILKSKWFNKWAKKNKISNPLLTISILNFGESNCVSLGSNLYKLRISRTNNGKSGGFRIIIVYKKDNLALFVVGFAKNEKDNISISDLSDLKKQAKFILNLDTKQIISLIDNGSFIKCEGEKNE